MDIVLNRVSDSRLPIYQRLKDDFVRRIAQGEWAANHPIPSETQLAAEFNVSVGTVRRAIDDLVQGDFLYRTQGKGTFLKRANFGTTLERFFRHTDASGVPLRPQGRMLSVTKIAPQSAINAVLELDSAAPLLELKRLRLIAEVPKLYEEIYVDPEPFAQLTVLPLDAFSDLLYPLYEQVCGQRVFRATETIRFDQASDTVAEHLDASPGEPVAVIERLAIAVNGRPLEWRCSVGLARQFAYSVELR